MPFFGFPVLKSLLGTIVCITSVTYERSLARIILAAGLIMAKDLEGSVKRWVLGWLFLALAGISFAEQAPSAIRSDTIFWWQAAGISGARLKRLTQDLSPACRAITPCSRAVDKSEPSTSKNAVPKGIPPPQIADAPAQPRWLQLWCATRSIPLPKRKFAPSCATIPTTSGAICPRNHPSPAEPL